MFAYRLLNNPEGVHCEIMFCTFWHISSVNVSLTNRKRTDFKLTHYRICSASRFIAWDAAGWHPCLDVLNYLHAERPIGRLVEAETMIFDQCISNCRVYLAIGDGKD